MTKLLPATLLSALLFAAPSIASACGHRSCEVRVEPGHWTFETKQVQTQGRWAYENKTVTVPGRWETTYQTVTVPGYWRTVERQVRVPVRSACHGCSGVSFGNRHFRVDLGGGCNHGHVRYVTQTRCERVWVPACTTQKPVRTWIPACTRVERVRVWKPGCYQTQQVKVWVPERTVSVCQRRGNRADRARARVRIDSPFGHVSFGR